MRLLTIAIVLLIAASLLGEPQSVNAQPREKCTQERADAEEFFLDGQLDEAIALLQQCLGRETLFVEEAVQVYRLLSLAHLNNGDMEQAQQAVRDLLAEEPTYQADPVQDPPSYATMVAVIRQEMIAQAPPEEEAVPLEEEPVTPQAETTAQPEEEQSQVERPPVRPEETVATPVITQQQPTRRRQGLLRTPKSWVLATGGAIVVAAAVALALGGSSGPNTSALR